MGTIADKLTYLQETKTAIKTAIENKGVSISDEDSFRSYSEKIDSITTGEGADLGIELDNTKTRPIYNYNYMSYFITKVKEIPEQILAQPSWANLFAGFYYLTEVPSNLDTSEVTNMTGMFKDCYNLENFPVLDTSDVTDMTGLFQNCKKLTIVPQLNLVKVTSLASVFSGCQSITYVPFLNCEKITSCSQMLYQSAELPQEVTIEGFKDLGKAYTQKSKNNYVYKLELHRMPNLTHDSLMNVINNLYDLNLTYDVANGGTLYEQGLVLGSANIAKLTEEEIAIATNKGWLVS